jgi:deoxyribonuclease V
MRLESLHGWKMDINEAADLQIELAKRILRKDDFKPVHYVAGVDVSAERARKIGTAAVVVVSYPELEPVEIELAEGELGFPYIPGYLSFREMPVVLMALEKLRVTPDLVMVDGQGICHPRRLGIASHLGLFLNAPTIGCAKSRLIGECKAPPEKEGALCEVTDKGEVVAACLSTKASSKPLYISVGHKVSLVSSVNWVIKCLKGYRLPEPTRLAHLAAGGKLKLAGSVQQGILI